jgi:HK97 family phage major capsid protein
MSKEDTLEIDDAVVTAVAEKAAASLKESMGAFPTAEQVADAVIAKTEKTVKKDIHEDTTKTEKTSTTKTGIEALPKEVRFAKGLMAFKNNDAAGIAEYNGYVNKAWREVNKANYQNVTTTADGGALVPDPEFVAEVERLTDDYGVVSRLATIRKTDRDSVTLLKGTNEIRFTRTGEAEAKNAQKLTYAATTAALDKYIATLVMTSEVIEDAAINLWNDAANEIARARAFLFDDLVFNDATYGLLSAAQGDTYKTLSVGTSYTDFSADDAMNAQYKVVSSARRNGRYFMHPTVWNALRQLKTGDGTNSSASYLFGGPGQAVTPQIDGVPVELVDVLPAVGDITANEAFAVFGDLSRVKLHVKRLLETKVFDSGVVKDAGGTDINLITQDSWAIRATLRCVPQTRFEGAFVIIGTGTVS